MSGPPGTSRPSQPTPGTAPTPPPRRQRTLPTPEELRSPPASRETWAADDSVTGGSRGSLPPGAGYAHNTSGVKPVRPRGVEEAVDMLVTRKNHSPSSSYPINLLSSVPELRHTVLDDGSTPRTSPILLSVSSPSSSPKLNRPGLSAGILSAPVLATSRFNSLPPLRHSASTERPTSSFFPNSTLPPATASPRSASPFEYGSPRRSFASPPLQQVGEQFIATPSINDSYAPQEQPERIETLRERNHRASLIPSFVPAPAFSSGDRGPYPPHQQRISALSPAMSVLRRTSTNSLSKETTSNDYFVGVGMGQEGVGAYRSGQTLELVRSLSSTKAKGKGKETDVLEEEPEEEEVSPPGWRSSTFVAPAAMNNIPVDMVGVGRNSFLGPVNPNAVPTSPKGNTLSPPPNPLVMASPTQPILSPFLPQPSVCVECMMRDRDMVDIDVTGVDIWERESDAELKEGLLREAEEDAALEQEGEGSGSEENRRRGGETRSIRHSGAPRSSWSIKPPSSSAHSSSLNTGSVVSGGRRRLGLGQPLTAASLKLWTSMVRRHLPASLLVEVRTNSSCVPWNRISPLPRTATRPCDCSSLKAIPCWTQSRWSSSGNLPVGAEALPGVSSLRKLPLPASAPPPRCPAHPSLSSTTMSKNLSHSTQLPMPCSALEAASRSAIRARRSPGRCARTPRVISLGSLRPRVASPLQGYANPSTLVHRHHHRHHPPRGRPLLSDPTTTLATRAARRIFAALLPQILVGLRCGPSFGALPGLRLCSPWQRLGR